MIDPTGSSEEHPLLRQVLGTLNLKGEKTLTNSNAIVRIELDHLQSSILGRIDLVIRSREVKRIHDRVILERYGSNERGREIRDRGMELVRNRATKRFG